MALKERPALRATRGEAAQGALRVRGQRTAGRRKVDPPPSDAQRPNHMRFADSDPLRADHARTTKPNRFVCARDLGRQKPTRSPTTEAYAQHRWIRTPGSDIQPRAGPQKRNAIKKVQHSVPALILRSVRLVSITPPQSFRLDTTGEL